MANFSSSRLMFQRPQDAITSIEVNGFNWRLVRDYFQFTDGWLSEGEYDRLLDKALNSIKSDEERNVLLDMLDLQYAVFLEQVALQEKMLRALSIEAECVAFSERVMTYLQINSNHRPHANGRIKSARTVLIETVPGQLIDRLLGASL